MHSERKFSALEIATLIGLLRIGGGYTIEELSGMNKLASLLVHISDASVSEIENEVTSVEEQAKRYFLQD